MAQDADAVTVIGSTSDLAARLSRAQQTLSDVRRAIRIMRERGDAPDRILDAVWMYLDTGVS